MVTNDLRVKELKDWIAGETCPKLEDLVKFDWPSLNILTYLSEVARGTRIHKRQSHVQESEYVDLIDSNNEVALTLIQEKDNSILIQGSVAQDLKVLLIAIKIHEYYSYEWVWLPPDIRAHKISNYLLEAGITNEQFRRAKAIWINQ
jgi:hypothetical protein